MIELALEPQGHTLSVTLQHTMDVTLDQFPDEAIIAYLLGRGYGVDGVRKAPVVVTRTVYMDGDEEDPRGQLVVIEQETIDRAALLVTCGQRQHARDMLIEEINSQSGERI